MIEPSPPLAWKIPCSYSKKARIVNKDGAWNGLIPKYFVWKDIASLILSSSKFFLKSLATDAHGFNTLATRRARLVNRFEGPVQGVCKQAFERSSFFLLSLTYFSKPLAFLSPDNSRILSVMRSKSLVASIWPPAPKTSLYDGSVSGMSSNSLWASNPTAWKICSITSG